MTTNLFISLQITALGMGLVFAAIILLWWMMNLLTSMTADKEARNPSNTASSSPAAEEEVKVQAAAVAVAIALAEQQVSVARPLPEPPTTIVSAWQLGMRTRQLQQKGPIRRPRKIG